MWKSIQEVKKANKEDGGSWFSPVNMRGFNTEICTDILHGRFFITSDNEDSSKPWKKRYTIRIVNENGRVSTWWKHSKFQQFKSPFQAIEHLEKVLRCEDGI